jgi:BolA protein
MPMRERIEERLVQAFAPERLTVLDESERHRGHAGWQEGGESHFRVAIAAASLAPLSRLERHRAVHRALGPEIIGAIHALALEIEG